ncbi:MAG: ribose 5-phosphate isomerase B [Alphaproteobacteria bacterium]|nr:ribose 5-phosphate isomerase B [Alphaproteobacteria bacterium]MBQ8660600.1 ribose 5-phosphate isomerase B [Alphaproteobacteria bacterium]
MKNIVIGSDHAGVELKSFLKDFLQSAGYSVSDIGTFSKESCDYPDVAQTLANNIKENPNNLGILICGTGIGMSIAVNRFNFIRGAVLYNNEVAKLAREHNDANVAILGARMFSKDENLEFLKTFLSSDFSNEERHKKRITKLS